MVLFFPHLVPSCPRAGMMLMHLETPVHNSATSLQTEISWTLIGTQDILFSDTVQSREKGAWEKAIVGLGRNYSVIWPKN